MPHRRLPAALVHAGKSPARPPTHRNSPTVQPSMPDAPRPAPTPPQSSEISFDAARQLAQHRVHHARREMMPGLLRPAPRSRRSPHAPECDPYAAIETRPVASAISISASSFALGRLRSVFNLMIQPQSASAARRAPAPSQGSDPPAMSASTLLPRNKSSECACPRSTARRIWKAAFRAGETADMAFNPAARRQRLRLRAETPPPPCASCLRVALREVPATYSPRKRPADR